SRLARLPRARLLDFDTASVHSSQEGNEPGRGEVVNPDVSIRRDHRDTDHRDKTEGRFALGCRFFDGCCAWNGAGPALRAGPAVAGCVARSALRARAVEPVALRAADGS